MSPTRKPRPIVLAAILLAVFLLSGCVSLAEDITPPPNLRMPTPFTAEPAEVSVVFPLVPPDPEQGRAIYAEKCLPCHGETGMGDGPQAGNLPNPAPPIGSVELARQSKPVDWFNIVTRGNLERMMPGFTQSLDDRQRWDVVAYVYSLSAADETISQGKVLYTENCAACHGVDGAGDGPQAANLSTKPASWQEQARLVQLSESEMADIIAVGAGEMPGFAATLNEGQIQAVTAYLRSLGFASAEQDPQASASTPESTTAPGSSTPQGEQADLNTITIRGTITNASSSKPLPEDLKITLLAFKGMEPAFEQSAELAEDGSYQFSQVEFQPDYVYMVRADVADISYNSDIVHASDITGEQVDLPVQIFDTTTDLASLKVDRLHVFFDFSQPGKMQVVELFIISNTSDKVVVPAGPDQSVIQFPLPEGATNLQFEDGQLGQRYLQTDNGFGDRMSISPGQGQHQVLFAYDLPYDRKLDLELSAPLQTDAAIVMVPQSGVRLKSSQLTDAGQRDVQGMSFQMYQVAGTLAAGEPIELSLSGSATAGEVDSNSIAPLLIGAGVFVAVLAGGGYFLIRRRESLLPEAEDDEVEEDSSEPVETSEELFDAILALDDLYQSGKLPESAYQSRRAELKARLAAVLANEK